MKHAAKIELTNGETYRNAMLLSYPSFSAYAADIADPTGWANPSGRAKWTESASWPGWYGLPDTVTTWKQTAAYLLGGWSDGVERMEKAIGGLRLPAATDVRRRPLWAPVGDELNLERVLAGNFDNAWRTTKRRIVKAKPRVRIVVDILAVGDRDAADLFWRGAAGAMLASVLSKAGWQTELWAGFCGPSSQDKSQFIAALCRVKGFGEPMNLAALCAIAAHPATFRQGGHALGSKHLGGQHGVGGYYCSNTLAQLPEAALRLAGLQPGIRTLYVPGTTFSAQAAQGWLTDALADLEAAL